MYLAIGLKEVGKVLYQSTMDSSEVSALCIATVWPNLLFEVYGSFPK